MMRKSMTVIAISLFALAGCESSGMTTSTATMKPTADSSAVLTSPSSLTAGSSNGSEAPSKVSMSKVIAIRLADAKSGWIGGKGWIARTDDSGKKWQVQYEGAGYIIPSSIRRMAYL